MTTLHELGEDIRKRIQELAYMMWESAGRQHGMALEYWVAAEREVLATAKQATERMLSPQPAGTESAPAGKPKATPKAAAATKPETTATPEATDRATDRATGKATGKATAAAKPAAAKLTSEAAKPQPSKPAGRTGNGRAASKG